KLHFFVTYEGKRYDQPIVVLSGVTGVESLLPPDVAAQLGPSDKGFKEDLFFAKLDWQLSDIDQIELSGRLRDETSEDFGNQTAQSAGTDKDNNDNRVLARWQRTTERWSNDLAFTYEDAFFNPVATNSGNGF